MNEELPLLVLMFIAALAVIAYWRIVLMLTVAAMLSVFAVGIINVANWFGTFS